MGDPPQRRLLTLLAAARSTITGSAAAALAGVGRERTNGDLGRLAAEGLVESSSSAGPLLDRKWKITAKGRASMRVPGSDKANNG
jgi:hypothetical protein